MSDFGADIFDQETPPPPSPPANAGGKRKGARKPRKAEALAEPAGTAEPAPPVGPVEPTTETADAAPQRRPSRRRRAPEAPDAAVAPVDDKAAVDAPKSRRRRRKAEPEDRAPALQAPGSAAPEPAAAAPETAPQVARARVDPARLPSREPENQDTLAPANAANLSRWTQRHNAGHGEDAAERRMRVAVLLDLHHLQEAARDRGAELSFRKLLRNIAGERRVLRAVCYLLQDAPKPAAAAIAASGFEVHVLDSAGAIRDRMQIDAAALPSGVETVVLAPGTADQIDLSSLLAAAGMRIETASFETAGNMGCRHRQLGRECVFVP